METTSNLPSSRNILIWRGIGIVAFIGYWLLFWLSTLGLQNNVEIFYWQRFSAYLDFLRFLTFFIVPVAIWYSSTENSRVWLTLLAIFGYCLIFGYLGFVSIFYSVGIKNVGTVELKGDVYHLTEVRKFDYPIYYYLGRCGKGGFDCVFHQIYGVSPVKDFVPEIRLTDKADKLIFLLNGEMIYNFDGASGSCIVGEYGYCVVK